METHELKNELIRLSEQEMLELIEYLVSSLKERKQREELQYAAEELKTEYEENEELTAFSSIDLDSFYEAR